MHHIESCLPKGPDWYRFIDNFLALVKRAETSPEKAGLMVEPPIPQLTLETLRAYQGALTIHPTQPEETALLHLLEYWCPSAIRPETDGAVQCQPVHKSDGWLYEVSLDLQRQHRGAAQFVVHADFPPFYLIEYVVLYPGALRLHLDPQRKQPSVNVPLLLSAANAPNEIGQTILAIQQSIVPVTVEITHEYHEPSVFANFAHAWISASTPQELKPDFLAVTKLERQSQDARLYLMLTAGDQQTRINLGYQTFAGLPEGQQESMGYRLWTWDRVLREIIAISVRHSVLTCAKDIQAADNPLTFHRSMMVLAAAVERILFAYNQAMTSKY